MMELPCKTCGGSRLKPSVLSVLVGRKNIYEVTNFSIKELKTFINNLKLSKEKKRNISDYFKRNKFKIRFLDKCRT